MTIRRAFTRVEAVATIGVVVSACAVSVPTMQAQAQLARRGASTPERMRQLAQGLAQWTTADGGVLPLAYAYGADSTSWNWNAADQGTSAPNPLNGYVHWSGWLMSAGLVSEETFRSSDALRGGAPPANPGPDAANWEPGQINVLGSADPSATPLDRQAARMAFAPNSALMPRNRLSGIGPRFAQRVNPASVNNPAATILLAQLHWTTQDNWSGIADAGIYKSHRPLTPFLGVTSGTAVFDEPTGGSPSIPRFRYPALNEIAGANQVGCCVFESGQSELNLVSRGMQADRSMFAFLDGHVAKWSLADTITQRQWGDRFYSITGNGVVAP